MAENNKEFEGLYQIQKTIGFELKTIQEHQGVNFVKSQDWLTSLFKNSSVVFDEEKMLDILELSRQLRIEFQDFIDLWKTTDLHNIEIKKPLVEWVNRNEYHKLKSKTIKIKEYNPEKGNEYDADYRMTEWTNLFIIKKLFGNSLEEFEKKLNYQLNKAANFENKVIHDFKLKTGADTEHKFSGKVKYYGNVRAWIENLLELLKVLEWLRLNLESEGRDENLSLIWNNLEKIRNTLKNIDLIAIKDFANENTKKEVELTTLNFKAVNKNPEKIQQEEEEVNNLEKTIKNLESELEVINNQKLELVKKLDYALTRNLPELDLLNTECEDGEDCNELLQKKSKGMRLDSKEEEWIKEMKFQKTVLKYLKLEGVLITDEVNKNRQGKTIVVKGSKYLCLHNYRQGGEKLNPAIKNKLSKIQGLEEYSKIKTDYENYIKLLKEKKDNAVLLGDKKSLYNALFREVSRQKQCNHFATICRDNDEKNPFYYLVLIPNQNKELMNVTFDKLKEAGNNWQMLNLQRLTFKALEKLALLESSSFNQEFEEFGDIKNILKDYKVKKYQKYILSREEKVKYPNSFDKQKYIEKMEKEELQKLIQYCNLCIKLLIEKEKYDFEFDFSRQFDDFDDYKSYIEPVCNNFKNC